MDSKISIPMQSPQENLSTLEEFQDVPNPQALEFFMQLDRFWVTLRYAKSLAFLLVSKESPLLFKDLVMWGTGLQNSS